MAKTRAYGSDVQCLAAFEATYGTAPNGGGGGVYTKVSFSSADIGAEKPLGYSPLLGQGRDAQDPFYDATNVEGSIKVPLELRAIGFWLKGVLGAPATVDNTGGKYTHTFKSGGDLLSLALEFGHTKLATQKHFLNTGAKLDTLSFPMQRTGAAEADLGVIAQGETSGPTAQDASPLSYALKRFNNGKGSIKVAGGQLANVTAGQFSFSNNMEKVETIRDDGLIDGADETEATATGTIDVRFSTDTTLADAIDAETPVALEYGFTIPGGAGHALTFKLPRVFLPRKKLPISGPGGISVTYDWQAAFDSVEGHMLEVILVNDVASY